MCQNICQNAFYLILVLLHNEEMDHIFWCNWCRLCANEDSENSINIVCNNKTTCSTTRETKITLQEALEKYFWVQTSADNTMPNKLCTECFALVSSIINFNERVERVQQMYNFLLETPPISNPYDLKSVRSKFNVLDNDRKRWLPVQGSDSNLSDDIRQGTTSPMCGSKLGIHIKEEQTGTRILNNKYSEEQGECHRNSVDLEVMMCGGESDPNSEEEVGDPFDALTDNCEHADMEENCNNMDVLIKGDEVNRLESPFSNETPCLTPNSREDKNNKRKKRKKLNGRDCRKKKHGEDTDFPLNVKCRECGESFYLYSTLLNHLKQCHGDNIENKQWKCPSCDRILQSWYNFARHMRIHMPVEERKTKKCSECESRFTSKAQLEAHINFKHKNDKPFICEECGCCLRTKSNLRQHALIHSSDAPFECEVCKKKFKNNSRLKIHMDTHSPNKYICATCGLQLNSRATLNRHFLVHSDDTTTKHSCDYCGRAFKRAKALKNHLLLHTGLKPYSCEFCDRTFANGSNCRSHMKKMHPEELAALEASGIKSHAKNIPKLETLKALTKAAEKDNLTPVVTKFSGCFAFGKKPKTFPETDKLTPVKFPHKTRKSNCMRVLENFVKPSSTNLPLAGNIKLQSAVSTTDDNSTLLASVSPTTIPNFNNIYQHLIMKNNPTVDLQIKQPPSSPSLSPVVNNNSTTFSPHHDPFFNDQPQPSVENALTTDQYI